MQECHKLPKHIAIIMDGNGRWAQSNDLPRFAGHEAGVKTVKRIIRACAEKNISVLSLFAFGRDNWSRPSEEVSHLMSLFIESLDQQVDQLHQNNIRLMFSGDRQGLSQELRQRMDRAITLTQSNLGLTLNIVINYSGQWDIVQAVKKAASKVQAGDMTLDDITSETFEEYLSTAGLPAVDLFIRTSGEQRISNFFLWQLVYAELFFCEQSWPDFSIEHFEQALLWFESRERRYGLTSEQLTGDKCA